MLIAVGRDASDVALTTSFGAAILRHFEVVTAEVTEQVAHAEEALPATRTQRPKDTGCMTTRTSCVPFGQSLL